jgi:GNAT superfamily N-acetyltransferase
MELNSFSTDVIFPHQEFPLSTRYIVKISEYFSRNGENIPLTVAAKAIAMRDLLKETYHGFFPFKEVNDPITLAEHILNYKVFPFFFVMDSKVVGVSAVIPHEGCAEFGRTAVKREWWGRGIGDLLLNARYTFARIYEKKLKIRWFYSHVRAANRRIQEIWLKSPHKLLPVGIAPYYLLDVYEFMTIFLKHFLKVAPLQKVQSVPEAKGLIEAVCLQYKSEVVWEEGKEKQVECPNDIFSYYTKVYIRSEDFDIEEAVKSALSNQGYCEFMCPVSLRNAVDFQKELLSEGFIPNAFYPAINGQGGFISFGKLKGDFFRMRAANFPRELLDNPVGKEIKDIYDKFCEGRMVIKGDPFI